MNILIPTYTKRFILYLFLFFWLNKGEAQSQKSEILWDSYGVPHIFGHAIRDMYYGFGWSQMHNHGNLVLQLYGKARGRAAEYWGSNYLNSDKQIQLFEIPALAEKEYAEQNAEYKDYLDAFVEGMNAYAQAHIGSISRENRQVLPINSRDVLSHTISVLFLQFVAQEDIGTVNRLMRAGSNAYAISPSRSASKHAMLLANPHLPWFDYYTFFEAHLQAPGFDAYGVSLVGLPVLNIAFNERLGWTHTVNTIDASDRYELTLEGDGYWLDSVVHPFRTKSVVLKIRQADSSFRDTTMIFRYSLHGPVIGVKRNKAYAIRIAGMENPDILFQWHQMAKANTWQQFQKALKMMQLPMFNVIYADASGNIFYLFDGNIPRRIEGDWNFWHGLIDGSYSKYIWHSTHPYEDLPKLFNPKSGFIQNANDPPWNCTYPPELEMKNFPTYMSPQEMDFRPQRAINMIKKDSSIGFEKLIGYKLSTRMETADRFLDTLLADIDRYPDSTTLKAEVVLRKWDRATDSDSRGAVLFAAWFDQLKTSMYNKPWDPNYPLETPYGLKDPKGAVELLKKAAEEVIHNYDSLNVAWGDVYRFRINQYDYPANGGDGKYGIFRSIYFRKEKGQKYRAIAGDSYVAVTEFGPKVRARVLLSYGNASQPESRHGGDQLSLLSRKELRVAWLDRKDILKHLEEKEELEIGDSGRK